MPEDNDYTPAPWASHDTFKSARAAYDIHAGRSYDDAVKKGIAVTDLVPDRVSTDSENPIVIVCDVTGSMGEWPATIFSKLPYLDHEAKFYFGDNYSISFAAVGDAYCDKYALQVQNFDSGEELEKKLKKLVIEGGGGGSCQESYDLAAIYYSRNCDTPNAIRPILIFIGDEGIHPQLYTDHAEKFCKVKTSSSMFLKDIMEELTKKWDVYIIRKPYGAVGNRMSDADIKIESQWEELLGKDHIAPLPEASRVVDVIFGIFAKATGKIKEFKDELKDRQLKDADGEKKIEVVMKSLVTIHGREPGRLPHAKKTQKKLPGPKGASITRRTADSASKSSKSLLD